MNQLLTLFALVLISVSVSAQKASWKELDEYHSVMALSFHPAENGDLQPVMKNAADLAQKASLLQKSPIPTDYQKKGVKESVELLAKESKELEEMVKAKKPEADIKKAIFALHDRFHEVMEKCHH